jgi:hypothetical protein
VSALLYILYYIYFIQQSAHFAKGILYNNRHIFYATKKNQISWKWFSVKKCAKHRHSKPHLFRFPAFWTFWTYGSCQHHHRCLTKYQSAQCTKVPYMSRSRSGLWVSRSNSGAVKSLIRDCAYFNFCTSIFQSPKILDFSSFSGYNNYFLNQYILDRKMETSQT